MKKTHFVSIIIPTKNEEKVIAKCLTALQNLNTPTDDYEVIIADNSSLDRTVKIAEQFNVRIVNIDSQRTNVSGSRNIGATHAKGDILAFVDADCVVSKDWLNNALVHFDHEDTCLAGYKYTIPENSSTVARSWDYIFENRGVKEVVAWVPAGNMFISRKCFDSVGGFDDNLVTGEDVDLCSRLKQKGYQILSDPNIQVTHLGTPQTYSGLFKKELWHGIGAVQTFINDLRKVRNLRAVMYAAFFSFGLTSILFSLIISLVTKSIVAWITLIAFIMVLLIIPLILAFKISNGQKRYKLLLGVWMVYLTYGVARAICLFRFLSRTKQRTISFRLF